MKQEDITVLMVAPGEVPQVVTLKTDLDSVQKAVSIGAKYQGLIEIISLGGGACIFCNEEGKLIGLEGNRRIGNDIIAGVFYVIGENKDGELTSLNEKQIRYYDERLRDMEQFSKNEVEGSMFAVFYVIQ